MYYDIETLISWGYGSLLVCDDNGNVVDECCVHYADPDGDGFCVFCGAQLSSYLPVDY